MDIWHTQPNMYASFERSIRVNIRLITAKCVGQKPKLMEFSKNCPNIESKLIKLQNCILSAECNVHKNAVVHSKWCSTFLPWNARVYKPQQRMFNAWNYSQIQHTNLLKIQKPVQRHFILAQVINLSRLSPDFGIRKSYKMCVCVCGKYRKYFLCINHFIKKIWLAKQIKEGK